MKLIPDINVMLVVINKSKTDKNVTDLGEFVEESLAEFESDSSDDERSF